MGGRSLITHKSGTLMGMPFEGMQILAYDTVKKKVVSPRIDNFGTGIHIREGSADSTKGSIELSGPMFDPMTNQLPTLRSIITHLDVDPFPFTMFIKPSEGLEFKSGEGTSTRMK